MRAYVTEEILAVAQRESCTRCPVALALAALFGFHFWVSGDDYAIGADGKTKVRLPVNVQERIRAWDWGGVMDGEWSFPVEVI